MLPLFLLLIHKIIDDLFCYYSNCHINHASFIKPVIRPPHRGSITLSASTLIYDYVMMRPDSGRCVFTTVLHNMLPDLFGLLYIGDIFVTVCLCLCHCMYVDIRWRRWLKTFGKFSLVTLMTKLGWMQRLRKQQRRRYQIIINCVLYCIIFCCLGYVMTKILSYFFSYTCL